MAALSRAFVDERPRWVLWCPVLFGFGIALYFAVPFEPGLVVCLAVAGFAVAATIAVRGRPAASLIALCVALAAGGFAAAKLRAELVAAPMLTREIGPVGVEGRILQVEEKGGRQRLVLDRLRIGRLPAAATPARVRVVIPRTTGLQPGQRVALRAVLSPPSPPAAPGAFDFARQAYFARLGGVGFAYGRPRIVAEPSDGAVSVIALERLRQTITARILTAIDGPAGGVAAAMVTGERGAIPEDVLDAMRDSGLAHLLAISGLHMGLVAGLLFVGLRLLLACHEGLALRYPIKKWAAAVSFLGAAFYLAISGASIPTQRAFIMVTIGLVAVMADRNPISMRLVAWAAGAVLLLRPESLVSVSFQMSFAAVVALVALYEWAAPRLSDLRRDRTLVGRLAAYFGAIALSTIVATAATAPFAAYHFNRVALFALIANVLAMPLAALWIMPCAIVALILMPVGLDPLALVPMGWGIDALLAVARTVAALPHAAMPVPSAPTLSLALAVCGGLWLCLWHGGWRRLGVLPILSALVVALSVRPPDILVDASGRLAAVRGEGGAMLYSTLRAERFERETWGRRAGVVKAANWETDGAIRCDLLGCIYISPDGRVVAFVKEQAALIEDCGSADLLIARFNVRPWRCRGPSAVIDGGRLRRDGAHAVWLERGGMRIETVAQHRGHRPWSGASSPGKPTTTKPLSTVASTRRGGPAP